MDHENEDAGNESDEKETKRRWSFQEDAKLSELINVHGANSWSYIASLMDSGKNPKQCRER